METIPDLGQRLKIVIEACHSLSARPYDEDLQQRVLGALIACDTEYPCAAPPLVRGLANLVRGYASILRRQLESPHADHHLIARAATGCLPSHDESLGSASRAQGRVAVALDCPQKS